MAETAAAYARKPEKIANEETPAAFRSAAWFWNSKSLNALVDAGDFVGITKKINGGTNGLEDRLAYYRKAKVTLGVV